MIPNALKGGGERCVVTFASQHRNGCFQIGKADRVPDRNRLLSHGQMLLEIFSCEGIPHPAGGDIPGLLGFVPGRHLKRRKFGVRCHIGFSPFVDFFGSFFDISILRKDRKTKDFLSTALLNELSSHFQIITLLGYLE